MSRIITVEGSPVLVRVSDVDHSKTQRFRPKKRKKTYDYGIRQLRPQQREALAYVMKTGAVDAETKRAAGLAAGYSPTYAVQAVDKVLERREIVELLEKHGVTQDKIAKTIAEGLEAIHPLAKGRQPDHHARHKFVHEANQIRGNFAPTKVKGEVDIRAIHVHMTPEDVVASEKYRKMRGLDAQP